MIIWFWENSGEFDMEQEIYFTYLNIINLEDVIVSSVQPLWNFHFCKLSSITLLWITLMVIRYSWWFKLYFPIQDYGKVNFEYLNQWVSVRLWGTRQKAIKANSSFFHIPKNFLTSAELFSHLNAWFVI